MRFDKFGTAINHKDTFEAIAKSLRKDGSILVAWSDSHKTQYDILFCLLKSENFVGPIQSGLRSDYLMVSIMKLGAFGFRMDVLDTHASYLADKLFISNDITAKKFSTLINSIKKELKKHGQE